MLPWASHCRRTRAGRAQDNCILIEQLYGVFLMNDWCELEKLFSTPCPFFSASILESRHLGLRKGDFSFHSAESPWLGKGQYKSWFHPCVPPLMHRYAVQTTGANLIVVPWPLFRYLGHQVKLNRLPIHHESHDQSFCLLKNHVASL